MSSSISIFLPIPTPLQWSIRRVRIKRTQIFVQEHHLFRAHKGAPFLLQSRTRGWDKSTAAKSTECSFGENETVLFFVCLQYCQMFSGLERGR